MKVRTEMGHFWITFENGYTLSVFNGYGSHTENHFAIEKYQYILKHDLLFEGWDSNLVEIAILNPDGDLITRDVINSDDSVKTVDVNELIKIINKINDIK